MKKVEIWAYPIGSCVGVFYPSMISAARSLDLQQSHVSEVLSGKRKRHKGYTFKPVYCSYYERKEKMNNEKR